MAQSPSSREFLEFENYVRQELPPTVRELLETAIHTELEPLESRLRDQIISIVEDAQSILFSRYRATMETGSSGHASTNEPRHDENDQTSRAVIMGTSHQPPAQVPSTQDERGLEQAHSETMGTLARAVSLDSGYGSDLSLLISGDQSQTNSPGTSISAPLDADLCTQSMLDFPGNGSSYPDNTPTNVNANLASDFSDFNFEDDWITQHHFSAMINCNEPIEELFSRDQSMPPTFGERPNQDCA